MSSKILDKIIEYGFYLLVFLLPLQTRLFLRQGQLNNSYFEYWTVSLYAVDILLLLILSLAFYKNFARIIKIENKRYWFLAGLELAIFVSIFFASDKLLAVYGYIRFLLGVGLFWLVIELKYNQNKMLFSFLLGAFWQAVIGIWQFFSQSTFASEYLGAAMHNAGDLGASVIETNNGERWLRAYGALDHPNMLGGFMVVAILVLIIFLLKQKNENNFHKAAWPVFLLTFLSALFFSFSRAAWLGLFLGLAVLFFTSVIKKNLGAQKRLLEIFLFSGIILFIFFSIYQNLFATRLLANGRLENKSNIERLGSYKGSWDVIKESKFGVGINNYASRILSQDEKIQSWDYQPVHNVFLLIWSEIGIVGLFLFVGFILWIAQRLIKRGELFNLSIVMCLATMFMFDHWWWSLHFGVFLFWFAMGMVMRNKQLTIHS